ncbi:MAG: FAD-dependent oxidoreductase [Acidobacteria bacterium]|nr:FAD-dependent oxidoreductase [Acidobacteriota bacterium]
MGVEFNLREKEGITIVDLHGRLMVGETAGRLREQIRVLIAEGRKNLVLNLAEVDYIDSTGLGTLVICFTGIQKAGGHLRLLVIGGLAAGLSAAARARRIDPSLEIIVLEKGEAISYGSCGLPYYLEGQVRNLRQLVLNTPESFSRERNIGVRTRAEATAISHPRRQVILKDGGRVSYDRLVIATGSKAVRKIAGAHLPNVFTLQTLEDAERLKQVLSRQNPRRAVVIGAGYLGLELAEALRTNGLDVVIVEQSENALNRADGKLREVVARQAARFGVEIRFGCPARQIEVDRVNDIPCDLVILTAGFEPNVQLAREAGIEIGRTGAIRVDERMETSLGGVFAAGDCAETVNRITGRPMRVALATVANRKASTPWK